MMWQRYFFVSFGIHLILATLVFLIWPSTRKETRLEIFISNSVSPSQDSSQKSNEGSHFSPNFNTFKQTPENRVFKKMAIPNTTIENLLKNIAVPMTFFQYEIRPLDDVPFTSFDSQRTYTPSIDDLLIQSDPEPTSGSSIQIEWHEGGELISDRFNASMFHEISLENPLNISISLEVGEDGIVKKIERTITGQRKIDQAVESFLNQFTFRPADQPYQIKLSIRLIPGAIFR